MRLALLRVAAVVLAVATAVYLVQLGRAAEPRPPIVLLLARALTLAALLHTGLFLAPLARRPWHRVAAAAAMLPSTLIIVGWIAEAVLRPARGVALAYLTTAVAVLGLAAYAVAYWIVARQPWKDA